MPSKSDPFVVLGHLGNLNNLTRDVSRLARRLRTLSAELAVSVSPLLNPGEPVEQKEEE